MQCIFCDACNKCFSLEIEFYLPIDEELGIRLNVPRTSVLFYMYMIHGNSIFLAYVFNMDSTYVNS